MKGPVRSTRVRLLGRKAQEDVDEGDARRARAMDGPDFVKTIKAFMDSLVSAL